MIALNRAVAAGIAAALLLAAGCSIVPAVYHEGQMAYPTDPGSYEFRAGVHSGVWNGDSGLRWIPYGSIGLSVGQKVGPMVVELGANAVSRDEFQAGLQVGLGLARPAVMLRASAYPTQWYPIWRNVWWQGSALFGTPSRDIGAGIGGGAEASPRGLGPIVAAEYRFRETALRVELSADLTAPWAPAGTNGQVITLGISIASRPEYNPFFGTGISARGPR